MVRPFALAPARAAALVAAAGLGIVLLWPAASRGEPLSGNAAAKEAVQEALQREIYGLAAERENLLRAAVKQSPNYAPALWQLGQIKDARHGWMASDDFIEQWNTSRAIKRYLVQRDRAADTVEGQLALAEYCQREGLTDQMRAALTRVLEHDPNHEGARAALGFVRMGPLWLSRAEIKAEEAIARARDESISKWHNTMQAIATALASEMPEARARGAQRLRDLRDASAIPAMEQMISRAGTEAALAVVEAIQEISDPEASLSLARHAVFHPSLPVREAASSALAHRDLHSYVPALVELMVTPVSSRIAAVPLPGGRIGYRHAFGRERADRQDLLVLDTEYERVDRGGTQTDAMRRVTASARGTALALESRVAQENDLTLRLNNRIAWVLNRATQQELPPSPENWWKWWNDQNEILPGNQKTMAVSQQYRRVQIVDPLPVVSIQGGTQGGGTRCECLVAGTLVWTASGPVAVEKIKRGDMVLSQHVDSGELSFKPVLTTTTRPIGRTVKFTAGQETFECTGGHVFWVAGDGWRKASQLEGGMLLHTSGGPVPIRSVETGDDAETYNLVVADFSTYFVGQQKILSHDFTPRRATSAVVPGLKPQ
jgi:hypothetical protein